jgi:membrane-bound serine protease (ClpP class)
MLGNDWFDFRYEAVQDIIRSVLVVVIALLGSIGLAITLLGSLTASPLLRNLVLDESQDKSRGFTVDAFPTRTELAGRQGTAATELRPSGKVDLDDARYDAMTQGEFIARGAAIEVLAVKGNYLMVKAV